MSNAKRKSTRNNDIWKKAGGVCAHCGKPVHGEKRTVDHIIPRALGGGFDQRNLMPLCRHCNMVRGDTDIEPVEFYEYAQSWAIDDYYAYLFEWRLEHSTLEEKPL